jgi:lysozyme family protein
VRQVRRRACATCNKQRVNKQRVNKQRVNMQRATSNVSTSNVQQATCQQATCNKQRVNMQRAACKMQLATGLGGCTPLGLLAACNMQHAPCNTPRATCDMPRCAGGRKCGRRAGERRARQSRLAVGGAASGLVAEEPTAVGAH